MPSSTCSLCLSRAQILRPKTQQKLCAPCFLSAFESEIHQTITSSRLFSPGERVAIGASGGKDSTVLAAVLKTLNEKYHYGVEFVLLSIDEGIKGYRDDSLETVKRNSVQYDLPLKIVSYSELYGWTMDQVVRQVGKKGNCTYCGVFRRQALDRGAAKLGIKHVVTGHNADDIAETVLMNLLRGDLPRLARATRIMTETADPGEGEGEGGDTATTTMVKRSKPLKWAYEKEIVLYAHYRKLDYFSTECIYSPEAFRGSARTLIKSLERIRPSAILDVVKSGEDMAKLVPVELRGGAGGSASKAGAVTAAVDPGEEEGEGGCGSANGRSSGGEMATVEAQLQQNERAEGTEVDFTKQGQRHDRCSKSAKKKSNKVSMGQQMGRCSRCGYLSSQAVCKACMLLEGLNKNRPRVDVSIEIAEADNSRTLTRRMEGLGLPAG